MKLTIDQIVNNLRNNKRFGSGNKLREVRSYLDHLINNKVKQKYIFLSEEDQAILKRNAEIWIDKPVKKLDNYIKPELTVMGNDKKAITKEDVEEKIQEEKPKLKTNISKKSNIKKGEKDA